MEMLPLQKGEHNWGSSVCAVARLNELDKGQGCLGSERATVGSAVCGCTFMLLSQFSVEKAETLQGCISYPRSPVPVPPVCYMHCFEGTADRKVSGEVVLA